MTFATRRRAPRSLAALVALVALIVPLALAGAAVAQTSSITQQDCNQGTIRDKAGQAVSKAPRPEVARKQVKRAGTCFGVWPLVAGGVLCLAGAAAFGLRRSPSAQRI